MSPKSAASSAPETDQDKMIAAKAHPKEIPANTKRQWWQGLHPAFWICSGICGCLLVYIGLTSGAQWYTVTYQDPGQFGPYHGETITATFGGVVYNLYAINQNGQVLIIDIRADDISKTSLVAGPNLLGQNYANALTAKIGLKLRGDNEVIITVYTDTWVAPGTRGSTSFVLSADKKGHLILAGGGK